MAFTEELTSTTDHLDTKSAAPPGEDADGGEQPPALTCREAALRHENLHLERLLRQAQAIIDLQKRINRA